MFLKVIHPFFFPHRLVLKLIPRLARSLARKKSTIHQPRQKRWGKLILWNISALFLRTIKVFNIYWLKPKYKTFKELQFRYTLLNKIFKTILSTVFWNILMKGNLYHFPLLTKTKIMYNLLHLLFFSIEIFLFYWINKNILIMISNVTDEICSDCRLDSSLFKPRCTNTPRQL